jgi:hypothetical protein
MVSSAPLATVLPLGANATDATLTLWRASAIVSAPDSTSQTRTR